MSASVYRGLRGCQAQSLLNAPDVTTARGLRDRAILAVLLGCGLRRSEVAALTFAHVQQRDGRWCIVDLVGKHGRVRTAPMPTWVRVAIDAWTTPAGITDRELGTMVERVTQEVKQTCARILEGNTQSPDKLVSVFGRTPRSSAKARPASSPSSARW